MKKCTNCGIECSADNAFCISCGSALGQVEQPKAEQQVYQHQPTQAVKQNSESAGVKFVQNYLGFVVFGLLLLYTFALIGLSSFSNPMYLSSANISNILRQFWLNAIIVVGVVTATRIKGPDLSMGSLLGLAAAIIAVNAVQENMLIGIIIAIFVCFLFGLLNGTIISLLNAPVVIVTLVTAAIVRSVPFFITDNMPIMLESTGNSPPYYFLFFVVSLIIGIAALAINRRLVTQKNKTKHGALSKVMVIVGYGLIAIIAGIAGYALLTQLRALMPNLGQGYEINILLVFAAIQSSKLLNNSFAAMGYGLLIMLVLVIIRNALHFMGVIANLHFYVEAFIALVLLCTACAAQGGWRSMLNANLNECEVKD